MDFDLNSLTNSLVARGLMAQYKADIGVLLTNRNYDSYGLANSLDPFSLNKFVIAEVPFINPYQYEWQRSNNPNFTNSQILGNSADITIAIPTPCSPFYLRLKMTNGLGQIFTATQYVSCAPVIACDRDILSNHNSKDFIYAAPNPAQNEFRILGIKFDDLEALQCYSMDGKMAMLLPFNKADDDQINVRFPNNPTPGIYVLKLKTRTKTETLKLVIQ